MNQPAHKCKCCKKAFQPVKVEQKYCSSACRQAAYRRRKNGDLRRFKAISAPTLAATVCEHCQGGFWAKTKRARFCSTSCRTLHHRALKEAIPAALVAAYDLPIDRARDVVDCQPMPKLRSLLKRVGLVYHHDQRAWVDSQLEASNGTS